MIKYLTHNLFDITNLNLLSLSSEASYLQGIRVGVRDTQSATNSYTGCGEVNNEVIPYPGAWINVKCAHDISGRFVIVKRNANAPRKPDSIAIAEVRVFVKDGSPEDDIGVKGKIAVAM